MIWIGLAAFILAYLLQKYVLIPKLDKPTLDDHEYRG